MKTFVKSLGAFTLAGIILAGCGDAEVKEVKEEEKPKQEQAAEPKEEAKKEFYSIGETVSVDGMEITLVSAQFTDPAEYTEATKGKVMTLMVNVINNSSDNGFVDNTEFAMAGASGTQFEAYFGYDDANMFTAELKKGNKTDGKLAFDVADENEYILYYEPSFTFKENAEIKFKITKAEVK